MRRFQLHRDDDQTGFSGTGIVAEGVAFGHGIVVLHWKSWPSSLVLHAEGMDGVMAVHGHDGRTRLVWLDETNPSDPAGEAPDSTYPKDPP